MDRFDRGVLALLGGCFVATSLLTGVIWYDGLGIDLVPGLWPLVFSLAGITTIGWALWPENYILYRVSGVAAISALVARAVNAVYVAVEAFGPLGDLSFTLAQAGVRISLFLMLSVLVSYTWSVVWERFAWIEDDGPSDSE